MQSSLSGSTVVEKNLDRLTLFITAIWVVCIIGMACRSMYRTPPNAVGPAERRDSAAQGRAPILGPMADVSDAALEPIGAVQRTRVGREATEPMRDDIRLLGTILGDTVREQNGDEVFDLVERARVESFRVRRSEIDRAELSQMFDGIDIHLAIPVIRAFSHFALLANVAEDIHRERRRRIHVDAGEPPQDSSLAATYAKLDLAELDSATVADALRVRWCPR